MTEEQQDSLDEKEEMAQGEPALAEAEKSTSAELPAEGRTKSWPVAVAVIAAILALLATIVCIAAAFTLFSGDKDDTSAATEAPVATAAPGQAMIVITEPDQGQAVDIDNPVTVQGKGVGLPEGNVVVEVLDWQGSMLARVPTTLQGRNIDAGGEGTWLTELTVQVEPGTAGKIRAYAPSPADGSIIAEDVIEVSLGQTPAVQSYIKINEPQQGDAIDVSKVIRVSGTAAGLPEGNVVVVAADQDGNVLDEQPTTLQGQDVGTGGEGDWSVELSVPASGQVPGYVAAFAASPKQRELIASDHVEVVFYGEYTLEGVTWLLDKTITGSEITAEFTAATATKDAAVEGSAGCNTYRGTYVVITRAIGRNKIEIGPLATTRMACDQSLMNQESLYLSVLESATSYRIEGFTLTVAYPGGELLFYDKNGPRPRR